MIQFSVRAYDNRGALRHFFRRADNEKALRVQLLNENLVIGTMETVETDIQAVDPVYAITKAHFIEQLGFFKRHSIPHDQAANSLREMYGNLDITPMERAKILFSRLTGGSRRSLRAALAEVIDTIPTVPTFAEALEHAPDVFSSDEITLIMLSENRKSQTTTFETISKQLHAEADVTGKVNEALRYPKGMALLILGTIFVYFRFVLPPLHQFMIDQRETIKFPLTVMIAISEFVSNPLGDLAVIGTIVGLLVVIGLAARKSKALQYRLDAARLNMPTFGAIERDLRLIRLFYSLKLMTESGREADALNAAIGTARGPMFREALKRSAERFGRANTATLGEALAPESDLFDKLTIETLKVREKRSSGLPELYSMIITMLHDRILMHTARIPNQMRMATAFVLAMTVGPLAYFYLIPSFHAIAAIH
jgi:type II secretory pathway component PulF